jgi:xylulokinase
MSVLIGIDLGTSCVKVEALDTTSHTFAISTQYYQIQIPALGHAEQNPADWWHAAVNGIQQVTRELGPTSGADVKGIGFSGQMHGLVMLDKDQEVLRPAIIWCDQRSQKQVQQVMAIIGEEAFKNITLNALNTGFLLASLLWVKENEPDLYAQIDKVMLPKDYLRFKMTGIIGTDFSDASASLALDVQQGAWSETILKALDIDPALFPEIHNSFEVSGSLTAEAATETALLRLLSQPLAAVTSKCKPSAMVWFIQAWHRQLSVLAGKFSRQ